MIKVSSIMGYNYYYRCTPDGRIQRSDDGRKWAMPGKWKGRRVNMAKHTVADVEVKLATQLGSGDYAFGATVVDSA